MPVDSSDWDAGRAMRACENASDYASICAGKREGDPSLRASWALPHHYLGKGPNANGVRAALGRIGSTQGLTNRQAAQRHLEAHMREINPEYSLIDETSMLARAPVEEWEFADSGQAGAGFSVRGYAAVFGQLSHDMGGFRTRLDQHALDEVLSEEPDVHFVIDHDTRYVLARTRNGTLKLSTDSHGLMMEAKVGAYSYAKDLRLALERGDIDQGSIALHIGEDDWAVDDDGEIVRTVMKASGLHDVTVTAQGAFPQTSLAVAYSLMSAAVAEGHLPEAVRAKLVTPQEGEEPSHPGGSEGEPEQDTRWADELRHRWAVHRDEAVRLLERSKAL